MERSAVGGAEPVEACPRCGFDADQLIPTDAAVAARSLARRWSELLQRAASARDASVLLNRQLESGMTVVQHGVAVAAGFERAAGDLQHVWEHDGVVLDDTRPAGLGTEDVSTLTSRLRRAGEALASVIERYDTLQWDRAGQRRGQPVGALRLARDAVHEASHRLRVCGDELEPLLPPDDGGPDDRW